MYMLVQVGNLKFGGTFFLHMAHASFPLFQDLIETCNYKPPSRALFWSGGPDKYALQVAKKYFFMFEIKREKVKTIWSVTVVKIFI